MDLITAQAVVATVTTNTLKPKAKAAPSKPLPEILMARFVRLIQGSKELKPDLRESIWLALQTEPGVTKSAIDVSFRTIGPKKDKDACWIVDESFLVRFS